MDRRVSEDWKGEEGDGRKAHLDNTRRFSVILEPGKIVLSEATNAHCNVSHRKSSIGLMRECFSEHPGMCYDGGDMNGTDTTLQVNIQ